MSPSLITRVARFARSPQGRQALAQARRLASDPKTRRQIEQVRERFASRRSAGGPDAQDGPAPRPRP